MPRFSKILLFFLLPQNIKDQEKDLEKTKVVLDTTSNLNNNLLRIYSDQFNKFKLNNSKRSLLKIDLKARVLINILIMKDG